MVGTSLDNHKPLTDAQLWGVRPVRWGLRMLGIDPHRMIEALTGSKRRETCDFLGVDLTGVDSRATWKRLRAAVSARRRELETVEPCESRLFGNLRLLQHTLDLTDIEVYLAAFRAVMRLHPGFEALAGEYIGSCTDFVFHRRLANLFETSDDAIVAALSPQASVVRHGILGVFEGGGRSLAHRIELIPWLIETLMRPADSAAALLASVLPPSREALLSLADYPHVVGEIALIRARLSRTLAERTHGVNMLLYGAPGVGKTELAAALAASLHRPLYALQPISLDTSQTPRDRLRRLVQLQRLARAVGGSIVLVDEAADMFPTTASDSEKIPSKAAVNECLERNPTPTIWISNRIRHMDVAFLRRFDMIVEVPPLPTSLKQRLLRDVLPPNSLPESELRKVSQRPELSPAVLTRMAIVARSDPPAMGMNLGPAIGVLANGYLRSMGARPLALGGTTVGLPHDPALLNTEPPLDRLLRDVRRGPGVRLLLYGPPGTGKTAWGEALAEHLDRPLIRRTASLLLSPYLGETEQNLREMFEEARRDEGVLLLDEADSFLSVRDRARARWEVTQTNELLTQMEAFAGFLVCTTNRLDDLDPAALRRFDFKVSFRPLDPHQRVALVRQCCRVLQIPLGAEEESLLEQVRGLDGCTPGDAAAVLRRMAVSKEPRTLDWLLRALADECRFNPAARAPIGFVH